MEQQNEDMQQTCKTCGDCGCYVDGKCFFYHFRGKVEDADKSSNACRYFMRRSKMKSILNPDYSAVAETMAKLKEQYGHDVRCGECSWFIPYENNSKMGVCGATRFDFECSSDAYACHRFELPAEGNKDDRP